MLQVIVILFLIGLIFCMGVDPDGTRSGLIGLLALATPVVALGLVWLCLCFAAQHQSDVARAKAWQERQQEQVDRARLEYLRARLEYLRAKSRGEN